jgi:hypothetical protein
MSLRVNVGIQTIVCSEIIANVIKMTSKKAIGRELKSSIKREVGVQALKVKVQNCLIKSSECFTSAIICNWYKLLHNINKILLAM